MASLQELLAKAKGKLEKIPMIAKENLIDAKEATQDFFTPDDNPDVRIGEFLREVPGSTFEVGKDIVQGTLRSMDFAGRKGLDAIFGDSGPTALMESEKNQSKVADNVENFLFGGRDKRSTNLSEVGETELGINKEKNPILAPLAGAGVIGLDLVPGGQGKSKGLKQLIKSLTDDTATTLAKSSDAKLIEKTVRESAPGLTDKEVVKLTEDLVGTKTKAQVFDVVNGTPKKPVATKADSGKILKVLDDASAKNGSSIKSISEGKNSVRVTFENGKNPLLLNKSFLEKNFGVKSAKEVSALRAPKKDTAYHGTPFSEVVKKEGFKPSSNGYFGKGVYLSRDLDTSKKFTDLSNNNSTVEDAGNGFFIDINTGKKTKTTPEVLEVDISGLNLQKVTFEDWSKAVETLRGGQGKALPKNYEELVQASIRKPGYDGMDIPRINKWDEPQILIYPESAVKLAVQNKVDKVTAAKKKIVDSVPKESKKKVSKALADAEKETKKLSPRRLQDAKKYGISEDVMSRVLHSKAGGRLTHEEASDMAESINAPIKDLLEKDPKQFPLDRPKIEAYSQELQGYFDSVVKELKAHHEAFPKDIDLKEKYQEASRVYMKARTTLEAVISEAGRVVEGSKVIGKYSRLPGMDGKIKQVRDQIAKFAERNPRHADLPTEFDMALETVDLNDTTKMLDFLTQWNRASFLQKLSEYQKAAMLSAFSTHAVNALGNAIQQVLDVPVRALAGTLDAGKSAVTGSKRTVYAGESAAQVRGAFRSAPSAIKRAVKALGNEHYAQELRRTEIEAGTIVPAIRGKFGKVVRLPYRLLQMADLGFRTVKKGAEGDALALRIAKTEGLKGKALKSRVAELKENLPADMLDLVDERVERSLMLEEMEGLLKTVEDMKNKYPVLQFVIPFYRTLVNLSREAYRMTPIGGVGRTIGKVVPGQAGRNIENAFHNKWTKNEDTKMEELSRQIIGTSIMTWVVTSMLNGDVEITGPAPSTAGDREVFYGQGKLPHSIRYGDTWIEFQRVQPIGQLLQIGASIAETIQAYKNTGELNSEQVEKEMLNSISDIGSMVFTQSPFTGTSDLFSLLSGGEYNEGYFKAANRYLGQLAGTFIPNILRRGTVAADPIIYEKRDIESQLKSRIPGMQKDLTPKRDTFGEIIRQGGTPMTRFASPIRTSESVENKLYDEMAEIEYTPTVPTRNAFNEDLSVKEYETLRLFYGPRFRDELWSTINNDSYKSLNDEQKRDIISGVSRKVLNFSRQTLFPVYLEKDQLRKQWEQDGYTPLVIEDALKAKFPYDKETLEIYAESILDSNLQSGEARNTIEELLKK